MNCMPLLMLLTSLAAQHSAFPQPSVVRFEIFRPEPTRFEFFAPTPVTFDLFAASPAMKRSVVFDPEHEHDKALVPAPIDLPPEQPPAAPELPVVRVYSTTACERCDAVKREYREALQRGALLPFHFRFEASSPSWVEVFPTLHFRGRDGWKKVEGWPGLDEFTRRFRAATAHKLPIHRKDTRLAIPRPSQQWTYPGRIQDHLREHGWTGSLEGLSVEEMERIHSALHEGLIQPEGAAAIHESRAVRFRNRPTAGRVHTHPHPKHFDPFLLVSILGLAWNVGTFLCGSCGS